MPLCELEANALASKFEQVRKIYNTLNELKRIPYSMYYKPMGDLPYISSEQEGGLIIHQGLIMRITICKCPIPIQEL